LKGRSYSMRILAVGAGEKGRLLVKRWAASGHRTGITSREELATLTEPLEADILLLDLQPDRLDNSSKIRMHGDGKLIIDCSNVRDVSDLRSGPASIAETIALACPRATVVKAFNVITPTALHQVLTYAGAASQEGYISAGTTAATMTRRDGLLPP